MHNDVCAGNDDGESNGNHGGDNGSKKVILVSNVVVKNVVRPINLQKVRRLPPYIMWIFLDKFVLLFNL